MDDLLIQTRESLTKYESSHPNLTNLWIKYIDIKVQNLEKSLNHCKHAINLMNTKGYNKRKYFDTAFYSVT